MGRPVRELARHVGIAGNAADAVAELVVVDDLYRSGIVFGAHAAEQRAEDLYLVDPRAGRDVVEQRAAHAGTGITARARTFALKASAVDQQLLVFSFPNFDVPGDGFEGSPGDGRAHVGVKFKPGPDLERFGMLAADDVENV